MRLLSPFIAALLLSPVVARADDPKITYAEHIQPIFREHCFTCHGQDTAKSDLSLDNYAAAMRGGASGEVVEPGDPDSSRLWALVSHTESPEMPPQQPKLADAKLALIKQWIAGGALENAGATAKIKKKPTIDLAVTAGSGKPNGPVAMPEAGKFSLQPVVAPSRPGALGAWSQPARPTVGTLPCESAGPSCFTMPAQ